MFSWICARCGRDNPPSVVNCLSCGARYDDPPEGEAPAVPEEVAASEQAYSHEYEQAPEYEEEIEPEPAPPPPPPPPSRPKPVARPAAPPITRPAHPPPPPLQRPTPASTPRRALPSRPAAPAAYTQPVKSGLPTWLMTILFFFAIVGIGAAIYYGIDYFRNRKAGSPAVNSAADLARTKVSNPLQKYIEVVGIRLTQDAKKKPLARFVIVNHSSEELDDVSATVTLRASTKTSDEDSIGTFTFKISSLGAFASKEMSAPITTALKSYELPDWQNMTPEVQITSQ